MKICDRTQTELRLNHKCRNLSFEITTIVSTLVNNVYVRNENKNLTQVCHDTHETFLSMSEGSLNMLNVVCEGVKSLMQRQECDVTGQVCWDFTWISSSEICCWSSAIAAKLSASRSLTAITSSLLCRKRKRSKRRRYFNNSYTKAPGGGVTLNGQYENMYFYNICVFSICVCVKLQWGIPEMGSVTALDTAAEQ